MCRFGETGKSEPGAWPEAALPIPFLSQGSQHLQMSVTLSGHLTRVVTGRAAPPPLGARSAGWPREGTEPERRRNEVGLCAVDVSVSSCVWNVPLWLFRW